MAESGHCPGNSGIGHRAAPMGSSKNYPLRKGAFKTSLGYISSANHSTIWLSLGKLLNHPIQQIGHKPPFPSGYREQMK